MTSFLLKNSLSAQGGSALGLSIVALALLGACGSDDGTDRQRGTAAKGEACAEHLDCASAQARCHVELGCTGDLTRAALQTECSAETVNSCAGYACLTLGDNAQGKTGLCSFRCSENADCGDGVCVTLQGVGGACLVPCSDNADCANGFVCVADPGGAGKACLVEPAAG